MKGFGTYSARETNYRDANAAFRAVLASILDEGREVSPRGKKTLELVGASFTLLDASRNIVTIPERKLSQAYSVAEWLWILLGRRDVQTIAPFNKNIAAFSDDDVNFFGAYGPWVAAQLPYVIENLRKDPDSRQAVLTIWQQSPPATRDVPCTIALQFLRRGGKLHAVATMRSNDAWLGLPYDLFTFTRIQAYVAAALNIPVGTYTHQAASLHLYEANFAQAEQVLAGPPFVLPWLDVKSPDLTFPYPAVLPKRFETFATMGPAYVDAHLALHFSELPEPWATYLGVLAYKRTKNSAFLRAPYDALILWPETGVPQPLDPAVLNG